uniref:1-acylglycerol-3-phosphate O-acyltransferase ABHD5 n=1 Tax=Paramormyrops kingsleyae TaxID=1676925 RepID=A0A3B3SZ41_9TELE
MLHLMNVARSESGWGWWPSWRPTSMSLLKSTEAKILARESQLCFHVLCETACRVSVFIAVSPKRTPLVMVHGFGGGVGLWIRNLDPLCRSRPVMAFDLLGFGRSSRPPFPLDAAQAEEKSVGSIEHWRRALGLERMILLGHSLGGYLATSYAIQYPERVCHLILVDPWGFPERPQPVVAGADDKKPKLPRWVKAVLSVVTLFNPLAVIRAAGPWGPGLVQKFRPDFKRKFEDLFDDDTMTQYIYHCNAQRPSGEVGFRAMSESLGWARRPMLQRVHLLPPELPVTLLYGARSWMDSSTGSRVAQLRPRSHTYTVIEGASHHIYADQPDEFNRVVRNICDSVD